MGPLGWSSPSFGSLGYNGYGHNGYGYNGFFRHRGSRTGLTDFPLVIPFFTPYPAYPLLYPGLGVVPDSVTSDPGNQDSSAEEADPAPTPDPPAAAPVAPPPPPSATAKVAPPSSPSAAAKEDEPAEEATVLVFRDGRQLQVENYAIVGNQVYNFSGSGPRRIALSDLDIAATRRVNDDRGVLFRLPN
jgi:hypothetical protein